MARYRFSICREDGTTPLGACPVVEVDGEDRFDAMAQLFKSHPGYEIVSCGLACEIDAYEKRYGQGV
jgi:hypothetical protein